MKPASGTNSVRGRTSKKRPDSLSAKERQRIASLGGKARQRSLLAVRRIAANFNYLAAIDELRGDRSPVERLSAFDGPLPGICREKGRKP